MEHLQHGMARKWDRHYRETRSNIAIALILGGIAFGFSLMYVWAEDFSPKVFNSRLVYHLMIDVEDYWTCNKDFTNFVIHEPPLEDALYSMFVFSVSNAAGVLQV